MRGETINGSYSYNIYICNPFTFQEEEEKLKVDKSANLTIRVLWDLISI